jgi:hypothetical protein
LSRQFAFAGRQVRDANIVATMIAHGEHRLLTFNTKDFERLDARSNWSSWNFGADLIGKPPFSDCHAGRRYPPILPP